MKLDDILIMNDRAIRIEKIDVEINWLNRYAPNNKEKEERLKKLYKEREELFSLNAKMYNINEGFDDDK